MLIHIFVIHVFFGGQCLPVVFFAHLFHIIRLGDIRLLESLADNGCEHTYKHEDGLLKSSDLAHKIKYVD